MGVDFGALTTGTFDGRIASFILDAAGNLVDVWVPDAPQNGSTIELPALASQLGLTSGSNKLDYHVATFPIVPEMPGDIPPSARTACSSRRSRRVTSSRSTRASRGR